MALLLNCEGCGKRIGPSTTPLFQGNKVVGPCCFTNGPAIYAKYSIKDTEKIQGHYVQLIKEIDDWTRQEANLQFKAGQDCVGLLQINKNLAAQVDQVLMGNWVYLKAYWYRSVNNHKTYEIIMVFEVHEYHPLFPSKGRGNGLWALFHLNLDSSAACIDYNFNDGVSNLFNSIRK